VRRFFEFDGQKIPIRRDESTELYIEDEHGDVQRKPITVLLGDGSWAVEGTIFTTNHLGSITTYQIVRLEIEIDIHALRGKYGQVRRRVLIAKLPNQEDATALVDKALRSREGKQDA
jgi:hypothetical protein